MLTYIIKITDQIVKIGQSNRIHKRLTKLRQKYGEFDLAALLDDEISIDFREHRLHERFKDSRIRGELFEITDELGRFCWTHLEHSKQNLTKYSVNPAKYTEPMLFTSPQKRDRAKYLRNMLLTNH